jgi:hypothetical protein
MKRDDMKNTDGQLYTIEGFAAALIMIMTAYLVINATSVYTAGDTHINDMQLESLGSDALRMMGTPMNTSMNSIDSSPLRTIIESNDSGTFKTMFLNLTNNRTGLPPDYSNRIDTSMDFIHFNASYTCNNTDTNEIVTIPFSHSRNMTGGEHTVRATKWVIVNKAKVQSACGTTVPLTCVATPCSNQDRAVLVEVLLWRD